MLRRTLLAVTALFGLTSGARAADEILIGAVYPLSGNAAAIGHDAQAAMETMAAIINGSDNVPGILFGAGGGRCRGWVARRSSWSGPIARTTRRSRARKRSD